MAKQVVGNMSEWSGMFKDFFRQIEDGSIEKQQFQAFLEHRNPFEVANEACESVLVERANRVKLNWLEVYQALDMVQPYGKLAVNEQSGLWAVPVIEGVTCNKVVATLRKLGVTVYLYADDLDKAVTKNDRDPNRDGPYVVYFKASVEADPENANQSANQRQQKKCKDITLLERLLLELAYFMATKQHLDVDNWTLCAGSRYSVGDVPSVCWNSGRRGVYVYWYYPAHRNAPLRARSVVSLS